MAAPTPLSSAISRRRFGTAIGLAAAAQATAAMPGEGFGIDVFGLRSQGFSAFDHLDFCKKQGANRVHFSEPRFLGTLEDAHLHKVREHAESLGLALEIGFGSICPTSTRFRPEDGTAEEQLLRMFAAAKILGTHYVRCYLGSADERKGPIPLREHMRNTIEVLRNVRKDAEKMGMRVALENHAGDMQGWQLRELIEAAGPDHVGALYDSGNATWTLEHPLETLEAVAPYVITSGIRDSAIWETERGAQVSWCYMGQGNVGIDQVYRRYRELCPGKPFVLEIINLAKPREFAYHTDEFWNAYRDIPADSFHRFETLARNGQPYQAPASSKEQERKDVEQAAKYCRETLKA